ncbi:oligosaccharide flippase family protein [Cohnella lubricantis]
MHGGAVGEREASFGGDTFGESESSERTGSGMSNGETSIEDIPVEGAGAGTASAGRPAPSGMRAVSMARGAAWLGGAALLSKLIGTLQKIPLQNLAGDRVFGLYSAVYALAVMWMTLAAAGIPVAVSALVAERTAAGDEQGARRVLRWSAGLLSVTGLVAFALLQWGAGLFADWMGASEAEDAIRTSSLALLFAPLTAVLRGYSQGRMDMRLPALSQLAEQSARVAFMLVLLFWALHGAWSAGSTAAAVHGGLAAGAAAGLLAMLWAQRGERRLAAASSARVAIDASGKDKNEDAAAPPTEKRLALLKRIAGVALPVAAASVVVPLFGLIDTFTVPRLLQNAGDTSAEALSAFGQYNRGIALLQLIVMAAGGAAAAVVPALTAARTRGDTAGQREQAAFAMRLAWLFGAAAAVGLALLAEPVNVALFADGSGTLAMALLAFAALGGALQAVGAALLQGLGDVRSPALILAAAVLLKAALNAALAPAFGIAGAAIAALAAYAAAAALNARALRRRLAQQPRARAAAASAAGSASAAGCASATGAHAGAGGAAWRAALALAAMAAAVALLRLALGALTGGLPARAAALLTALPSIAAGALVYAAALAALGAVGPRQWRALPGLGGGSAADRLLLRLAPRAQRQGVGSCAPSASPANAPAAGPAAAASRVSGSAAQSAADQSTPEG